MHNLIEDGDHVVVGVSGGADSLCLLLLLKEISSIVPFTISAVHVNHHLRGDEAVRDEEFTKNICEQWSIPCEVVHYDVSCISREEGISLEEAGRMVRREAFMNHWKRYDHIPEKKRKVALAHHQNDIAETLVHHLARGTDVAGLSPIRAKRDQYIRPLLCMTRTQIEAYLKEKNLEYMTDSTNDEDCYTRNKIRHHIIPYLEEHVNAKAVPHMVQVSESLGEVWDFLYDLYKETYQQYVEKNEQGILVKEALFSEKKLLIKGVLRLVLEQICGSWKNIGRVHIEMIYELSKAEVGKRIHLPYKIKAYRTYHGILFERKKQDMVQTQTMEMNEQVELMIPCEVDFGAYHVTCTFVTDSFQEIPEKTYTKWFDYDKIGDALVLRYRNKGDYLVVNAQGGRKKLKDYFINEKIPQVERDKIPLLCCGSHVAWVCGYRISERYKVDKTSKRIVKVQISAVHRK